MKSFLIITWFCMNAVTGCTQSSTQKKQTGSVTSQKVGGSCEGCEAIHACPVPFDQLSWIDTLPDFKEAGQKMVISGVIYKMDGHTPAKNVILYVYHTDQTGHYTNKNKEKGWSGRNGYIKGWMRTNDKGQYRFYTLKPASYPGSVIPAHIHPLILEPDKNEYYIDEYLFDDDPFLTAEERKKQEGRGGNGIIKLHKKDGLLNGERAIYLGRNIPNYGS
jgi:protocatechuate 3,4-dioxygenase, beta subunit